MSTQPSVTVWGQNFMSDGYLKHYCVKCATVTSASVEAVPKCWSCWSQDNPTKTKREWCPWYINNEN